MSSFLLVSFQNVLSAFSRGWGWEWLGGERKADCELPHGGSGRVAVVWGQSFSHLLGLPLLVHSPTWAEKFLNWPVDPIPSALLDPPYFHRGAQAPRLLFQPQHWFSGAQEVALSNWTQ